MDWNFVSDNMLIDEMTRRGYIVRHKSEARTALSWHRTMPFPENVDFRAEALEKIRDQIAPQMIEFRVSLGDKFMPEVHHAVLRVI